MRTDGTGSPQAPVQDQDLLGSTDVSRLSNYYPPMQSHNHPQDKTSLYHSCISYDLNALEDTEKFHSQETKHHSHTSTSVKFHDPLGDSESQQMRQRPALKKRMTTAFLTKGNTLKKPAPEPKVQETVGSLVVSAGLGAAACAHPLFSTVRPMVVAGKVEHYRSKVEPRQSTASEGGLFQKGMETLALQFLKPLGRKKLQDEIKQNMHKINNREKPGTFKESSDYLVNLTRALIKFGSPTHRLQIHVEQAGKKLGLNVTCVFLAVASFIHIEFPDSTDYELRFVKQYMGLDLDKSLETHEIYLKVYNDEWSPQEGSRRLITLFNQRSRYNWWKTGLWQALTSAMICTFGFNGSFVDGLMAAPMGFLCTAMAEIPNSQLYVNVSEVLTTMILSFIAAGLASTKKLCYNAMLTSSVVWLLPGFIITLGTLEISTVQNMFTGAVRLVYAVVYSLTLGIAIAIGTNLFTVINSTVDAEIADYKCSSVHNLDGPWWQLPVNPWLQLFTVPICGWAFSARMQLALDEREAYVSTFIASSGWAASYFLGMWLPYQPYLSAIVEAFIVGFLANVYEKYFHGSAFSVMVVAIFFLVPSALKVGDGGLYIAVSEEIEGLTSYVDSFEIGLKMISLGISLALGLCFAVFILHPNHVSRKTRGAPYTL